MWNECAFQTLFLKPEFHSLILNWKLAVIQAKKMSYFIGIISQEIETFEIKRLHS